MFGGLEHLGRLLRVIGNSNEGVDVTIKKVTFCTSQNTALMVVINKTSYRATLCS